MSKNSWIIIGAAVVFILAGFSLKSSVPAPTANLADTVASNGVITNIQFTNYLQSGLPEQDVFIEKTGSKTKVVRVEGDLTPALLAKTVYAAAGAPHDPFKVTTNPLGPFTKGKSLELTLGQWLAAGGAGTYIVNSETATLNLAFQKLIANAVYTVWCSSITLPPNFNIVDRPCGAADGSQNSFVADANGNAVFKTSMAPLPAGTRETAQAITVAYQSDGKTYGAEPGNFGATAHVQIFYVMPAPESTAPQIQ